MNMIEHLRDAAEQWRDNGFDAAPPAGGKQRGARKARRIIEKHWPVFGNDA
jgi:hypothetical protein